jgi:hypothetical protein
VRDILLRTLVSFRIEIFSHSVLYKCVNYQCNEFSKLMRVHVGLILILLKQYLFYKVCYWWHLMENTVMQSWRLLFENVVFSLGYLNLFDDDNVQRLHTKWRSLMAPALKFTTKQNGFRERWWLHGLLHYRRNSVHNWRLSACGIF